MSNSVLKTSRFSPNYILCLLAWLYLGMTKGRNLGVQVSVVMNSVSASYCLLHSVHFVHIPLNNITKNNDTVIQSSMKQNMFLVYAKFIPQTNSN